MRSVTPFVLLAVLGLPSLAQAQAPDPLLGTIDELIETGDCPAAMALLEHATGEVASLAGRRALCGLRAGDRAAVADAALALRATDDPWIDAHRPAILAALSATARAPAAAPGGTTSPGAPAASPPRTLLAAPSAPTVGIESVARLAAPTPSQRVVAGAPGAPSAPTPLTPSAPPAVAAPTPEAPGPTVVAVAPGEACTIEGNPYVHGTQGGDGRCVPRPVRAMRVAPAPPAPPAVAPVPAAERCTIEGNPYRFGTQGGAATCTPRGPVRQPVEVNPYRHI